MRLLLLLIIFISFASCWPKVRPAPHNNYVEMVFGNKPVYGAELAAKQITYSNIPQPVITPGNIYVKGNLIYQLEMGRGIHVIDNSIPSQAERIGFITVNGSSEISIKGDFLYTNTYDDLVVVRMNNIDSISEVKRVAGAFPEGRSNYFFKQPIESGYYECPRYDSVVIGWVKDSIRAACFKN